MVVIGDITGHQLLWTTLHIRLFVPQMTPYTLYSIHSQISHGVFYVIILVKKNDIVIKGLPSTCICFVFCMQVCGVGSGPSVPLWRPVSYPARKHQGQSAASHEQTGNHLRWQHTWGKCHWWKWKNQSLLWLHISGVVVNSLRLKKK